MGFWELGTGSDPSPVLAARDTRSASRMLSRGRRPRLLTASGPPSSLTRPSPTSTRSRQGEPRLGSGSRRVCVPAARGALAPARSGRHAQHGKRWCLLPRSRPVPICGPAALLPREQNRFAKDERVYKSFLEILNTYRKGQKSIKQVSTCKKHRGTYAPRLAVRRRPAPVLGGSARAQQGETIGPPA